MTMIDATTGRARRRKVLSYGGGLDSWVMLLDGVATGDEPDVVAFVDVADPDHEDPGEWPGTYQHIREVAVPFCEAHGIEFVWITARDYPVRNARSLFAWLYDRHQIPVAGPDRICTRVAKVERFERWLDDRYPGEEVEVWIGFEAGEEGRAATDPNQGKPRKPAPDRAVRCNRFPLMERGLCRCRCEAVARASGLPVPRKSACVFCPYGSKGDWQTLAVELPEVFAVIEDLEARKPPTVENNIKLSIMGFRTLYKKVAGPDGVKVKLKVGNKAPMLRDFIQGRYKAKPEACGVCGAPQRATKATGCGYLPEAA